MNPQTKMDREYTEKIVNSLRKFAFEEGKEAGRKERKDIKENNILIDLAYEKGKAETINRVLEIIRKEHKTWHNVPEIYCVLSSIIKQIGKMK